MGSLYNLQLDKLDHASLLNMVTLGLREWPNEQVPAAQAQGPEFGFQHPHKKPDVHLCSWH